MTIQNRIYQSQIRKSVPATTEEPNEAKDFRKDLEKRHAEAINRLKIK